MEEPLNSPEEPTGGPPPALPTQAPAEGAAGDVPTRRRMLGAGLRKLTYAAPVALLFHPKQAAASGGSQISPA